MTQYFFKATWLYTFITCMVLSGCSSANYLNTMNDSSVSYLKKIRKFTIKSVTADSIPLTINQATLGKKHIIMLGSSLFYGKVSNKASEYANGFKEALRSIGNAKAEYVPLSSLPLFPAGWGESESESRKWMEMAGVDVVLEICPVSSKLDYPARVPDLSVLNIFYTLFILDLWWIDLFSAWHLETEFKVRVSKVSNQEELFNSYSGKFSSSTGVFSLTNVSSLDVESAFIKNALKAFLSILNSKEKE